MPRTSNIIKYNQVEPSSPEHKKKLAKIPTQGMRGTRGHLKVSIGTLV
jgi:hypothetical protein